MAEEILDEVFNRRKETYCGVTLTEKLTSGGLSYSEIRKLENGVRGFKSTSLAYDEFGKIIDWDQYYEEGRIVERRLGKTIKDRIARIHPEYFHVIYFNHTIKNGEVCLEVSLP